MNAPQSAFRGSWRGTSVLRNPAFARFRYEIGLGVLVLVVLAAHLAIIDMPSASFVFDEAYYVPAARSLLTGQVSNVEHPPLAKALIAASIALFGDRGFAWRVPSVLAGTLAIVFLYFLTVRLSDKRTALLAAFLLGFESLWFVHSSIAMLDTVAVSLGLAALLFFVRGEWVWAGAVVGLAMLAKEIMVLPIAVLALLTWLQAPRPFARGSVRRAATATFFVAASAFAVFMAGLQIYDSAYDAFPTAFHHVARMVTHNRAIAPVPLSDAVSPLQWFSGFAPTPYYVTSSNVGKDLKRYFIQYFGQPNLVVVLLIWLALPFSVTRWKQKDANVMLHAIALVVSLAFFVVVAWARVTYPYYMLLCIPSICVLVAVLLVPFPRRVIVTYCCGVVLWFLFWFPRNLLTLGR